MGNARSRGRECQAQVHDVIILAENGELIFTFLGLVVKEVELNRMNGMRQWRFCRAFDVCGFAGWWCSHVVFGLWLGMFFPLYIV